MDTEMDSVELLLNAITEELPQTRAELRRAKIDVAAKTKAPLIRNDILLSRYRQDVANGLRPADKRIEHLLTLNGIRSESGIATVTVITKPYACPGRCVYCPTEARAPKSYLTNEPAVMRAVRNEYDPYRQVWSRLEALDQTGHPTDKIELIIKGGTWSFYPASYQQEFVQRCFDAANEFAPSRKLQTLASIAAPANGIRQTDALKAAQHVNETAGNRVVGLTIETRPDHINFEELRRLRTLGVTRVELGVQTLDSSVLKLIVRDHGTAEVRSATRQLRDAGFKIAYHLMPNLPGATPESDLESFQALFQDSDYRPDTMKLYPCVVIESAELYQWWRDGRYQPYDDETLIALLMAMKQLAPPYVRLERIIRDIPSTSIRAGCLATNLREEVLRRMKARGLHCRCIRCRQVRTEANGTFRLVRRTYEAAGGVELFLSFEEETSEQLAALLRLRIPGPTQATRTSAIFPSLEQAGLIRELHSYGYHVPLHARDPRAVQHQGFGQRLMEEAERIACREFRLPRIAVIAGVGAREYYRRLGYELRETYMVKEFPA